MFKGKGLKPGAFQLWVRGSQRAPPRLEGHHDDLSLPHRAVAAQVDPLESKSLKPVFHFIGFQGLKPGAFKLWMGRLSGFNLYVQPHWPPPLELGAKLHVGRRCGGLVAVGTFGKNT
jgi:hypothetical protein